MESSHSHQPTVSLFVACSAKRWAIGGKGRLLWNLPEDLRRFKEMTQGTIVIMGRKTYESLPSSVRPLPNRTTWVITHEDLPSEPNQKLFYMTAEDAMAQIQYADLRERVSVCGGAEIYQLFYGDLEERFSICGGAEIYRIFFPLVQRVYMTLVEMLLSEIEKTADTWFPMLPEFGTSFQLVEAVAGTGPGPAYEFLTYERHTPKEPNEAPYLQTVRAILGEGESRPDRTGVGTVSLFGRQMRFSLEGGQLPLLTTRELNWRAVIKELLFFLRGDTDSKKLEAQGVSIWRENTTREFLDKRGLGHYREGDMGPMYGWNWLHFGATYRDCETDYTGAGYNQLATLLHDLRTDPYSRRHLLTTYNPAEVSKSVLAPCHGIVAQFYVSQPSALAQASSTGSKLRLSCHIYNRSQDVFLGMPWNIAMYAVLTHLLAKQTGYEAHELILSTGDTHIYQNHREQCERMLQRTPLPSPLLFLSERTATTRLADLTLEDFAVRGYLAHPAIRASMAV